MNQSQKGGDDHEEKERPQERHVAENVASSGLTAPRPIPSPREILAEWRAKEQECRSVEAKTASVNSLSKWYEGQADALGRCADQLEYHILPPFERVIETASALEKWLGENAGTNDDWPIEIKADKDGADTLAKLLNNLQQALVRDFVAH